MENIENLNESELVELWQQYQAADKREQGQSVGLMTALMAIHRDTDPGKQVFIS